MTLLLALVLAFPDTFTARQGRALDGGMTAWAVECVNCSGGGGAASTVALAGPITIADAGGAFNVNPVAIASIPLVFIQDAGTLNVNPVAIASLPLPSGASTDATLSQLLDGGMAQLAVIAAELVNGTQTVRVSNLPPAPARNPLTGAAKVDGSGVVQPVSAATLPLPAGAATETGTLALILAAIQSVTPIQVVSAPPPLNPFLPRCNPVRRTGCQP